MPNRIIVRFIRGRGFVSDAIAFVTNSEFSHAEFGTPEGTWIGAHNEGGIEERPANYCDCKIDLRYAIPCSPHQHKQLMAWARSKIGTPYNFADIGGLLIHDRDLNSAKRYICSQFVCEGLIRTYGANKVINVLPQFDYLITPETLHLSPIFVGRRIP